MKMKNHIKQHDQSDCAAASVGMILKYYKQELPIMKIRESLGTDVYGTSVLGIVEGLTELGFNVKAIRVDRDEISKDLTYPLIAHVVNEEGNYHFVVVHGIDRKHRLIVSDPSKDKIEKISFDKFNEIFNNILILMVPTSDFEKTEFKKITGIEIFKVLIRPQKKYIILIITASFLLTALGIFSTMFSKILMDEIIPYKLKNTLFVVFLFFLVLNVIQLLLSSFRQIVILFLSRKIDIPLVMGYYNHIIHLPYKFFVSRKVGDIITRFQDALTIKEIFTSVSISLIMDIMLSIVTAIVLMNMNWKLFLILLFTSLINITLVYLFKKPYKDINIKQMEANSKMNSQIIESVENIETIKVFSNEKQQLLNLEKKVVDVHMLGYKEGVLSLFQSSISSMVGSLSGLLFMSIGAMYIMDGKMSIGDLLVFQSLSQYFTEPLQNLISLQLSFQEAQISMRRLEEIMSMDREDFKEENTIKNIEFNQETAISFKNVNFRYGSRPYILKDLSFEIKRGEKVAIVGKSGSGKTTISRLLLKFITANSGSINVSNYDINDLDINLVRDKISCLSQNVELFSGTILENIKIGDENATYEEIIGICKLIKIHDFIKHLPNEYNFQVEEGGSNLSGGEKQRIALARTLIAKPEICIFDEYTSNLDSFSEKSISQILFEKFEGKTQLIIAHRLSTIVNCDKILFLEDGTIVESGNHDDLMILKGKYYEMMKLQYIGFSEEKVSDKKDNQKLIMEEVHYGEN